MLNNINAVAFTEATNQSDQSIELMRKVISEIAEKHGCLTIIGNRTVVVLDINNNVWLDDVEEEIASNVVCDVYQVNFQDIERIYRNFTNVVDNIGSKLTIQILKTIECDPNKLDYKAIALKDFSAFYG